MRRRFLFGTIGCPVAGERAAGRHAAGDELYSDCRLISRIHLCGERCVRVGQLGLKVGDRAGRLLQE